MIMVFLELVLYACFASILVIGWQALVLARDYRRLVREQKQQELRNYPFLKKGNDGRS